MALNGDDALALAKSYVKKTAEGLGAVKGKDGFSPTITESPDNTKDVYRLDITTANGTFTTPNLKGSGSGGDGTKDYNDLENKPTLNGKTIVGNIDETDPTVGRIGIERINEMFRQVFGK